MTSTKNLQTLTLLSLHPQSSSFGVPPYLKYKGCPNLAFESSLLRNKVLKYSPTRLMNTTKVLGQLRRFLLLIGEGVQRNPLNFTDVSLS